MLNCPIEDCNVVFFDVKRRHVALSAPRTPLASAVVTVASRRPTNSLDCWPKIAMNLRCAFIMTVLEGNQNPLLRRNIGSCRKR